MPVLLLPTPLRPYANNQAQVPVEGATVGQALEDLVHRYPSLKPHLFNEQGQLRPFVNLFLDGEDVRYLNGLDTPLAPEAQLRIVPSIAGGVR